MRHVPVLREEVLQYLAVAPNRHFVDGTLGDAGHAEAILHATSPNGKLLGIDADPEAILRSKKFLEPFEGRVVYIRESFRNIARVVEEQKFGPVNGVLLDLGWSTPQFAERGRGFSFEQDEPLDMRYDAGMGAGATSSTAQQLLETLSPKELTLLFSRYGEEPQANKIARAIVWYRRKKSITTTNQLVEIVCEAVGGRHGRLHPATRVFQALRIAVNDELSALQEGLLGAISILVPGGRLAVISFHSGEDRIVKRAMSLHPWLKIITKKPVVAGLAERKENPRARSAKLRVAEKVQS